MWKSSLLPRFNDTDALGHVNNIAFLSWFEFAREPVFRIFVPDLDTKKWQLIVARVEVDYLAPAEYGEEVVIETSVVKVGNSSFTLKQEVKRASEVLARSQCVMVRYDYDQNKPRPLSEAQRSALQQHMAS